MARFLFGAALAVAGVTLIASAQRLGVDGKPNPIALLAGASLTCCALAVWFRGR